jgi:hypothetical protein
MDKGTTYLLGLSLLMAGCMPTTETETASSAGPASGSAHANKVETSTGGVLTKGETFQEVRNTALTKATNAPWVGMVPSTDPNTTSCAEGWSAIRMDDEDEWNFNSVYIYDRVSGTSVNTNNNFSVGGLIHSSSPWRAGGNTWIKYCAKSVPTLPRLAFDYSLISASNVCPANSYRFTRRFDNEDDANHNTSTGDITPNITSSSSLGSTILNFCFVPKLDNGPSWDPILDNQLVFGKTTLLPKYIQFHVDDEDDKNNNQWNAASGTPSEFIPRMQEGISTGGNTDLVATTANNLVTLDFGDKSDCGKPTTSMGIICTYQRGSFGCGPWQAAQTVFDLAKYMYCTW